MLPVVFKNHVENFTSLRHKIQEPVPLIRFRMDKAAAMLKKTDMSVSDVAAAVGYGDQLAFSKIFKQYYGESPRAFRENEDKLVLCAHKGEFERKDIF